MNSEHETHIPQSPNTRQGFEATCGCVRLREALSKLNQIATKSLADHTSGKAIWASVVLEITCKALTQPCQPVSAGATYTEDELRQRVKLMSNTSLTFSKQYGMLFILNDDNEILLNIGGLRKVSQEEAR